MKTSRVKAAFRATAPLTIRSPSSGAAGAPGPGAGTGLGPFAATLAMALAAALALALSPVWAADPAAPPAGVDSALWRQVQQLGERSAHGLAVGTARVEVQAGQFDPRLKLAACEHIEAYLPAGAKAWGRTRVGLRCTQGPSLWNVSLPITVKVFAPALVADGPLPAGTVLQAGHLHEAEVDFAAERSPVVADPAQLLGRTLARALSAGDALRQADLKPLLWFAAGDTVQVVARGAGFSVSGVGLALSAGVAGQPVRVRTDSGRVLSGLPVAANRVEVQL